MHDQHVGYETEVPLRERLWPDESLQQEPEYANPQWGDVPLAYRLWPEKSWPPIELLQIPPSPGVDQEIKRLFEEYCKSGQEGWD